ncbi:chemotaxis-specific protein-glutamate methyltransferase CheB [Anaeromyxobacter oryzae]|uniref:Protein-glutamate methylesterase/protein-glutamine glutaminase n=1 Tax=Anaeromyxobacter oryzae TaxID=2918170 RepID=A0ABM7X280_9BACT|nr:chemotaxis-specific protein-glutamate methyltransferase CheB [Anaeromyxobacter oryzae]BDG05891.1 chemotaxis response regulator protein-glutamate methylesterase of group 3 operon [Anaeromyxobacter oryzae]
MTGRAGHEPRTLRALVVDDSGASRAELTRILAGAPGVIVVGAARDGEEALREALRLRPDFVVLDLQMPRMDGFTFLRLLMAQRPTPAIVVSAQAGRSDVFKALELGALDFVAKPEGGGVAAIREELLEKCETVRALRLENLSQVAGAPVARAGAGRAEPRRVALVGASTGGPQAILQLLAGIPADLSLGFVIAQHMPERFTAAFAERLGRHTPFSAQEAADGDLVAAGRVLVAPGGHHLEVRRDGTGALRAAVLPRDAPGPVARCCPSIDRLFGSGARVLGPRACAAVLTGMGHDGRDGIVEVRRAGGLTLAESSDSAVVYGMPQAAAETGAVDAVLRLDALAAAIVRFAREP